MSDKTTTTALKKEDRFTEYVPFGAEDKIKLSIEMVRNLIAVKTKKGASCSDTDAIKFIAMCSARRLNPFEGDAFLIGYDTNDGPKFSLITAHQAFLKRAELHPEYNGMKSGLIIKRNGEIHDLEGDFYIDGDELLGGWATVYFKNRDHPMHKRVRLQRFKKAWGLWVEDPAGMIVKCAEADALRSSFPTMLGGLYMREETQSPEPKASKPIFSTPIPTTVTVQPEPKEDDSAKLILDLLNKAGIKEETMLEFLGAVGLADEEKTISALSEETRLAVVNQFDDFATRILEVEAGRERGIS